MQAPRTWAEGRGQIGVAAGMHKVGPGTLEERDGEKAKSQGATWPRGTFGALQGEPV